ncbi:pep a2 [Streptomyces sp. SID14478]|uniref:pep a2 n=1 Tax=Streptomyces sp. SID14478 TaxID=2706073 RepID=UPI0013D9098F|nr:pep a2 [Streptomyces sp. SID14478]NEB79085.1 pep a2 [Streptomyces sp. SID14478]
MNRTVPRYYHVEVDAEPERIGQVQRIVGAHLRYWGLQTLVTAATRGVGLLMEANEGKGPVTIETWWTGQHLITAASHQDADGAPRQPAALTCLSRIAALSDGWGSLTTHAQWIVWFSLRSRNSVREPLAPKRPAPFAGAARQLPRAMAPANDMDAPQPAGAAS